MTVSVTAVCRRPETLKKLNDQLSVVVASGPSQRTPEAESVAVGATFVSERPQLAEPGVCDEALAQSTSSERSAVYEGDAEGATEWRSETSDNGADAQPAPAADEIGHLVPFNKAVLASCGQTNGRCKVPSALAPADDGRPGVAERPAALTSLSASATKPDITVLASAVAASKLGLVDQLNQALATCTAVAFAKDTEDRTCLHYAAGYGHEECVSLLLDHHSDTRVRDANGDVPLHFAAIHGHPMCAYNITKACPSTSLTRNYRGQTPVEVAVACERGEVLNAMLLACAGDGSAGVTVQAMRKLLSSGAVPDTWAPNGSSALMLAAAANGTDALGVLLEAGATLELQDALGRSALMFAAGNCARDTLLSLLDAGACISQRDRRGRNVLDYAPSGSEVRRLLQARLDELEAVATRLQQDLLASLVPAEAAAGANSGGEAKAAPGSKKKKQTAAKKGSSGAVLVASKTGPVTAAATATTTTTTTGKLKPSGSAVPDAGAAPQLAYGVSGPSKAAFTAAPAAVKACKAASAAAAPKEAPASDDGDASAWQTVSSHKCTTGKQRQLQQQELHDVASQRAASATAAALAAAATASSTGGSGRPGWSASGAAVVGQGVTGLAAASATAPPRSAASKTAAAQGTRAQSAVTGGGGRAGSGGSTAASQLGQPLLQSANAAPQPPAALAAAVAAPDARSLQSRPKGPATGCSGQPLDAAPAGGHGNGGVTSTAAALCKSAAAVPEGTRVAFAATAPTATACGFKAALLGLDACPPAPLLSCATAAPATADLRSAPQASAAAAVHLEMSAVATAATPSASVTHCAGQAERKPAWGGAKLGPHPASMATSVAGCSPRSYPPLGAAAASCSVYVAAPPLKPQPQQAQTRDGRRQPQQQSVGPAAESYAESSESATAGSVPPSIASVAESEASSSTGHSTGSNTCAGASSPRSFGHDWTRPSPVDVLLHAALAASGMTGDSAGAKRPGHSKSSSDASSSSHLSFDGCAGGLDAVLSARPLPPPTASSCCGGLGVSLLGGTEVPAPRRSGGGRDTVDTMGRPLPAAACFVVGSPSQSSNGAGRPAAAAPAVAPAKATGGGAPAPRRGQPNPSAGAGGKTKGSTAGSSGGGGMVPEVARLKVDNETLQRRLRQAQQRHNQELASVIMDAEQHEGTVVERAIAQERLRITANLLAIGLCPEAILAVITPPGHVREQQQLAGNGGCVEASSGLAGNGPAPVAGTLPGGPNPMPASTGSTSSPPLSASSSAAALTAAVLGCRADCSHSSCDSACALSGPSSVRWEDGCSSGSSTLSGLSNGATAARDCGQRVGSSCLSFAPSPSPAIAIPASGAAATGCPLSSSAGGGAAALAYHSHPSRLPSFGSPGGLGARFGAGTSFGSGGLVGSLCAGLGLGLLSGVGGSCRGVGTGAMAAGDEEEEEEDGMDLPACGDISALLAMSDDDA